MCKVGDIIIVNKYIDNGKEMKRHSFVVIDDEGGEIQSLDYDIVCNVMSSFKNEEQKRKKLSYPGNFELSHLDTETDPDDGKDGFIKAEQLYFFKKDKIKYRVIGSVTEETFKELIEFIENITVKRKVILDNLSVVE